MRVIYYGTMLLLAGCSSLHSREKVEESNAAIRAAELAGAHHVPPAEYHLHQAKEANEYAKEQMSMGDRKGAESTLDRSEADADLAVVLTREEESREAKRKAAEQLNQLKRGKE